MMTMGRWADFEPLPVNPLLTLRRAVGRPTVASGVGSLTKAKAVNARRGCVYPAKTSARRGLLTFVSVRSLSWPKWGTLLALGFCTVGAGGNGSVAVLHPWSLRLHLVARIASAS